MDRPNFRDFLVRLAILSLYFVYKVDKVRNLNQMVCHVVQPMVLMNFAAVLGLEVRSTFRDRRMYATKQLLYESLLKMTDD